MSLSFNVSESDRQQIGATALDQISQVYSAHYPLFDVRIDLHCITEEEIAILNQEYRQIPTPTDVLSFPLFVSAAAWPTSTDALLIGSILICPSMVIHYQETLPQMVHHGLMHLVGLDHETDLPAWQEQEKRILADLAAQGLSIPALTHDTF